MNALVEESLNLAFHGARAEKQGFNVTLERSFDPTAGEIEVFPQEITRVLIEPNFERVLRGDQASSGGKRKRVRATVTATTRSLGDRVEIGIRDNGAGIPPALREKIFNPFFTTKPAGEGTGLGLSISHDIIVKQHSGSIEVDASRGKFTEFRIILPGPRFSLPEKPKEAPSVSLLILVVDDEPDVEVLFRQQFRRDLRAERFTMEFAQSEPAALQRINDAEGVSLILILSDVNMPGMNGLELLPKAKAAKTGRPCHHDHRIRRCGDKA